MPVRIDDSKAKAPGNAGLSYVYIYKIDGVVRYVGKGVNGRIHSHVAFARSKLDKEGSLGKWYNNLRSAIRKDKNVHAYILRAGLDELEAFNLESEQIYLHGREGIDPGGTLYNDREGGDGFSSEDVKRLWEDFDYAARQRERLRSPESRAIAIANGSNAANIARLKSPKMRAIASDVGKKNGKKVGTSAANIARLQSPDRRAIASEVGKKNGKKNGKKWAAARRAYKALHPEVEFLRITRAMLMAAGLHTDQVEYEV